MIPSPSCSNSSSFTHGAAPAVIAASGARAGKSVANVGKRRSHPHPAAIPCLISPGGEEQSHLPLLQPFTATHGPLLDLSFITIFITP